MNDSSQRGDHAGKVAQLNAAALPTELVAALYGQVGDFRSLPALLGFVAENTRADAIRLGLDLGCGYRHDCYVGSPGELDFTGPPDSLPAGWIDQRPLRVGVAGRRGSPRSGISLLRNPGRPAFQPAERQQLSLLLPHLDRVIALSQALESSRQRESCALATLDQLGHGVLMLRADGTLVHANRHARELLPSLGGRCEGRLQLPTRDQQARYEQALARVVGQAAPVEFLLDSDPPVFACLTLAPGDATGTPPLLTLTLRSQTHPARLLPDALREHYRFTPGEFRLCQALVAGWSLKRCASGWDRSYDTLRSQLKNLFVKTGVHRQADLVALLEAYSRP